MTKDELATYILQLHGVVGAGQTPSADDFNLVKQTMDNCHGELEQLEIALWPVTDIPDYAAESFAVFVEATLTAWGKEVNLVKREMAESRLRKLTADRRHSVGKAQYF